MRPLLKLVLSATRLPFRRNRRRAIGPLVLIAAWVLGLASMPSQAGRYAERIIKIVVPFPAGGPTDVAARLIAQSLSSRLGQTVLVENVSGAGGRLGARAAAAASPDGYTLLLGGTNVNAILGSLYKDLGFDPIASFAPVAAICVDSMALAISPRLPAETFEQFVQYAKSNPGKLTYGAPAGIYTQFAAEFFKVKTGTDILFVPYKGAAPAITDLLGGNIDMVFNNRSTLIAHFRSGKLRPLAVTSKNRWPELPDTPTMQELGVRGFPTEVWFGLLAPAGTPSEVIGALNAAVNDGLGSSDVRTSLAQLGMDAKLGSPQDFAAALAEQAQEWKGVIEATGVKGD
jgi:tripartite-type tricarboxylate transporter receptor subunit TctC